jgi:hypothetical protein
MPNFNYPRQCSFQYISPYPPNIVHNNYENTQTKPSSMQNYPSQVINHNMRENMVHSSYEKFIPQNSVHMMQK